MGLYCHCRLYCWDLQPCIPEFKVIALPQITNGKGLLAKVPYTIPRHEMLTLHRPFENFEFPHYNVNAKSFFITISQMPLPKFLPLSFCSFNPSPPHQWSLVHPERSLLCAKTCRSLRDFSTPSASFPSFSLGFISVSQDTLITNYTLLTWSYWPWAYFCQLSPFRAWGGWQGNDKIWLTVCAAADKGVLCTGVLRWLRLSHRTIWPE